MSVFRIITRTHGAEVRQGNLVAATFFVVPGVTERQCREAAQQYVRFIEGDTAAESLQRILTEVQFLVLNKDLPLNDKVPALKRIMRENPQYKDAILRDRTVDEWIGNNAKAIVRIMSQEEIR